MKASLLNETLICIFMFWRRADW